MLPIGKYERIKEIIREAAEADVENSDIEILSVLCDCDVEDLLNAPVSEVRRLLREGAFLTKSLNVKDRLKNKYITIDGVKYIVHTDFKDITTAQYIDFQTFYKDYEKNYCNVLATFIIPEGHQYNDGYDALETAEIFREKMPVEVAENACFFFAQRSKRSYLRGLRRLVWRTTLMEARAKDPTIKKNLTEARKVLMRQIEDITGLGRLMRSHIQSL
jgi:hypothetical protein